MSVRLADVARHVGVSNATVSRVLANKPHVSEELRQRVLAAVEELGYQPSRLARSLQGRRSKIIGVIISDIQNPFFTHLVRAVEDIAYAHEHAIFLCNTDEDSTKEDMYVNLMVAEHVAGVVAAPAVEKPEKWQKLSNVNIPVVLVDRRLPGASMDTVVTDNVGATVRLISHLIENGHRRIGAVLGTPQITTGRERYEGYVQALKAHGLLVLPELVRQGIPRETVGYQLTCALLELPEPPTALFTGNNLLTLGALRALQERCIQIPEDMALAAFDDLDWMSLMQPQLTVVTQPTYALGKLAAELLFQRLADSDRPPQEIVLEPDIVVRKSSLSCRGI